MLDALTRTAFEAICGLHLRILHDDLSVEWSPLLRRSSVLVLGSYGAALCRHLPSHRVLET